MPTQVIETWLWERLGLDPDSMAPGVVGAAIRRGREDHGCDDREYARILGENEQAWQALVDQVTVHETWFFRDQEPFQFLGRWLLDRGPLYRPVRLLSCPCATGEEPYSMAMTLLDRGFSNREFTIDAADVSVGALRAAALAEYRRRSLRATDDATRRRYLSVIGEDRYRLDTDVVNQVRLHHVNLLQDGAFESSDRYDVVCCRNLLIYLHDAARDAVFRQLDHALDDAGLLIVGCAEAGLMRRHGFAPVGPAAAFAFQRAKQARPAAVAP